MKEDHSGRKLTERGVLAEHAFGISQADHAHIMGILRDTLYTDKILAVLREYASNAWDAHRSVGKMDLPIKVTLPTSMSPTLHIRDYGPGLSLQEVFEVFTQYGRSTKRDDNDTVGMLGIGSKSGFAYSDMFTVISYNGGMKTIYVAVLDRTNIGKITKSHEEPCGDETGLEIMIAVRPEDIESFKSRAQRLYQYFEPLPDCNVPVPKVERRKHSHGYFVDKQDNQWGRGEQNDDWVAIMGCVPYRIDVYQIRKELEEAGVSSNMLSRVQGGLYFNIGEIEISASREGVKYSKKTKEALVAKIALMTEAFIEDAIRTLKGTDDTEWGKRLKARQIHHMLGMYLPKAYAEYSAEAVSLYNKSGMASKKHFPDGVAEEVSSAPKVEVKTPLLFTIQGDASITVHTSSRLIVRDETAKAISGYSILSGDHLIRPFAGADLGAVRAELDTFLAEAKLTGIPVVNLSTLNWSQNYTNPQMRVNNKKHLLSTFVLKPSLANYCHPYSDNWEIVDREPTEDDVIVLISQFQVVDDEGFYNRYLEDRGSIQKLGGTMPPIYGYKSTPKNPVDLNTTPGVMYNVWRKAYLRSLLTPERIESIQLIRWGEILPKHSYSWRHTDLMRNYDGVLARLRITLGTDHIWTTFLESIKKGWDSPLGKQGETDAILKLSKDVLGIDVFEADRAMRELFSKYPLFKIAGSEGLEELGKHPQEWLDYFLLVDRVVELDHLSVVPSRETENEPEAEEAVA